MKHHWTFQFRLFLPLAIAFSVFSTSCEWFKPARDSEKDKVYTDDDIEDLQGTRVFDPETGEWRTVREIDGKMETIKWTDVSEESAPPITTDGTWTTGPGGNNGNDPNTSGGKYNVTLVLPFLANRYDTSNINENAYWAMHYYSGAKLAYEALARDGVNLNVHISDSEASTAKVNRIMSDNKFKGSDLVIGPYKRDNVKVLAESAKRDSRPLAVPYSAQLSIGVENPNYIQLNPSLKSHCRAITEHARQKYRTDEIILVARDGTSEIRRFDFFQEANQVIEGRDIGVRFTEFKVSDETLDFSKTDISPYVREGKTSVFIIPSWNEAFVYSILHQLMMKQSIGEEIVVYGMPQWADFDQIDPEFFQNLQVHISSAFYIDQQDERVKQFKQKFYEEYGTFPRDEAYLGHDAMLYFGKMLDKWGRDFPKSIDREPYDVLHGRFEFERVVHEPENHKEDLDFYDQLENQFVHILEFSDFKFQPAN